MKICRRCGITKPITEFYPHATMRDGHLNVCRECKRADQRRYQQTPAGRETERRRNAKPERLKKLIARSKAFRKRNPEKYAAHMAVQVALKSGRLVRPKKCQGCGAERPLQAHHNDYNRPLKVEWLCSPCHGQHNPRHLQAIAE